MMSEATRTLISIYTDSEGVGLGKDPVEIPMRVQFVKESISRVCNENGITNQKVMMSAHVHALALAVRGKERMWKALEMAMNNLYIVTSTKSNAMDMSIQNQIRDDADWAKEHKMRFVPAVLTGDTDYVYIFKSLAKNNNVDLRIMAFGHQKKGAMNVIEHIDVAMDLTDLMPWNRKQCLLNVLKGQNYPNSDKNTFDWTGYYKREGYQGMERGFGARMSPPQQQSPKDQQQKPQIGGMKALKLRIDQQGKRRALGVCYVCGEGNHQCEECPLRSSNMKRLCWDCLQFGCKRQNCVSRAVSRAKWYWNGNPIWSEITKYVHVDVMHGGYWSIKEAMEAQKAKEEGVRNEKEWSITPPPVMTQRRRKELEEVKREREEMERKVRRLRNERNCWREDSERYEKKYKKERAKADTANKELKETKKKLDLAKAKLKKDNEYWYNEIENWRKKEVNYTLALEKAWERVRDLERKLKGIDTANDE